MGTSVVYSGNSILFACQLTLLLVFTEARDARLQFRLVFSLRRALEVWYTDKEQWTAVTKTIMQQDWSWAEPAFDYIEIYHKALKSWQYERYWSLRRGSLSCVQRIQFWLRHVQIGRHRSNDSYYDRLKAFWPKRSSWAHMISIKAESQIIFECFVAREVNKTVTFHTLTWGRQ